MTVTYESTLTAGGYLMDTLSSGCKKEGWIPRVEDLGVRLAWSMRCD